MNIILFLVGTTFVTQTEFQLYFFNANQQFDLKLQKTGCINPYKLYSFWKLIKRGRLWQTLGKIVGTDFSKMIFEVQKRQIFDVKSLKLHNI